MEQRHEFVLLALAEGSNVSALCRRFGVSRQTGAKWVGRFRAGGAAALADQSRRPRGSPEKTEAGVEAAILELRDAHPAWGGRKLRARLERLGHAGLPAVSTVTEVLRRNGRLVPGEAEKHSPWQRFEHAAPNDLWQMDFKGHVPMHRGGRCHPLTVLDDHSRFSLGLRACGDERGETVRGHLTSIFRRYGLPRRILMDNGSPWGVTHRPGERYTWLEVWLLRLGVLCGHGRPGHPQTQGKEERFHRTLNAEVLRRQDLADLAGAQAAFDRWRDVYNLERPNEAIGLRVPADRYAPSERAFPEVLPPPEYDASLDAVRPVKKDGSFAYLGCRWYAGTAFAGLRVGVRAAVADERTLEVRLGPHLVETIDTRTAPRHFHPKKRKALAARQSS